MADPTKYKPHFNYSGWEAAGNKRPKPGAELDIDFANIARSIDETIDALKDLRRSDGKLVNGIVGPDAFDEAARDLIAGTSAQDAAEDAREARDEARDARDEARDARDEATNAAQEATNTVADTAKKNANLSDLTNLKEARSNLGEFATVADVESANIPPVLDSIRTNGYYTPGDGGGALYKRVASEPSHNSKVQSADGSWWVPVVPFGYAFDSVSDMKASRLVVPGARVRTLGYYEPGDGGGNDYEIVAAGTGADDGIYFIDLSGSGHQAKAISFVSSIDLYVDPLVGSDSNTGTVTSPFKTISKAISYYSAITDLIQERVGINLAPGSYYEEVSLPRGLSQRAYIEIKGPDTVIPWDSDKWIADAGTDRVDMTPTAVIDGSMSPDGTGLHVPLGNKIVCRNIAIRNFSGGKAATCNAGTMSFVNCHVSNCRGGISNIHGGFVAISGGYYDGTGLGGDGYSSFYSATHNIEASSLSGAALFQNWRRGLLINEGAQGHLDYTRIHDNDEGLIFYRGAGAANTKGVEIYRNGVGLKAIGTSWFNNGIDFGTGSNANTVNVQALGGSPEFDAVGQDNPGRTLRTVETSTVGNHTGTTSETILYTSPAIRDWCISEGGLSSKFTAFGESNLTAGCQLRVKINGNAFVGATLDASSGDWILECEIFYAHASSQRGFLSLKSANGIKTFFNGISLDLKNTSHTVEFTASLSSASDNIIVRMAKFETDAFG